MDRETFSGLFILKAYTQGFNLSMIYMKRSVSKIFFVAILFFLPLLIWGQGHFTVTKDIRDAYHYATTLRKDLAVEKIVEIKRTDPENLLVYHVENYLDFFEVFINEDNEVFEQIKENKDKRLDKIKQGDKSSPYYRFCQAEINLQWALARTKFDQKITAAREIYSAYKLLEDNVDKHPEFIYNYKSLSIIHVLAKSIPGIVRFLFGIHGSIEQGTKEIKRLYEHALLDHDDLFKDEVIVIYSYILFYQNNQKEEAWQVLKKAYVGKNPQNPLISFIVSNMAQQMGENDLAIAMLENRNYGPEYMDFHYLDFLLGKFKLYHLEDHAHIHIEQFLSEFNGRHYIKEAYQKLAWYHLVIKDDLAGYKKNMKLLQSRGDQLIDEDKQALKESRNGNIPHPELLKARLLYDGSYYDKAYNLLIKRAYVFSDPIHTLEYNYRMGRITQALKNYPEAIQYYIKTINAKYDDYYFACNAALQITLILEEQGRYERALDYADQCLDLSPDQYKTSIHQKAKSAKQRIKEKLK